jgi:hypothetical protein
MAYRKITRDIQQVGSVEQLRDYLNHKSYGSKRLTRVFDRRFRHASPDISIDDSKVTYGTDGFFGGWPKFELNVPKEKEGKVYLDTGFVEITEDREIKPSRAGLARGKSLAKLSEGGIDGFRRMRSISGSIVKLYEEIFPGSKERY